MMNLKNRHNGNGFSLHIRLDGTKKNTVRSFFTLQ